MPIYLDRHYVEGATRNTLSLAHEKDLEVQDKYGVKFLTYWFDEERSTAFCLVDAPTKEAITDAHDEAHGGIPSEILEVDPLIVESFLGRVKDPAPVESSGETLVDSAFRGIMFTDLKDSTLMTTLYGDEKALHLLHVHNALTRNVLREHGGNEVKHTGDGFMASFTSLPEQVRCAVEIQKTFSSHRKANPDEDLYLRIGLSSGEPIEEHGDFFGSAVQLAARLCSHAEPDRIIVTHEVREHCRDTDLQFRELGEVELKGFAQAVRVHEVLWEED